MTRFLQSTYNSNNKNQTKPEFTFPLIKNIQNAIIRQIQLQCLKNRNKVKFHKYDALGNDYIVLDPAEFTAECNKSHPRRSLKRDIQSSY